MTFEISIAEFLNFKTGVPSFHTATVEHVAGTVYHIGMTPTTLANIKDPAAMIEHIRAAAKNNYESFKNEPELANHENVNV